MFLKKERLIGSLSFYQSEFREQGQKSYLFQDIGDGNDDKEPALKVAEMQADAQIESAKINRNAIIDAKEFDKEIAQIQASSEISVAREINDSNEISVDEFKAIDVITRNNLAGDGLKEFIQAVEDKTPDAIDDLQTLQKALKADGKYNGNIDEDFGVGTTAGMNALISENAPAIKAYYETKQLLQENSNKSVSPKDTPLDKETPSEVER